MFHFILPLTIGTEGISCKSTKLQRKLFKISSFRMTKCNTSEQFVREIDVTRNNYSHYCILGRTELPNEVVYDMYVNLPKR